MSFKRKALVWANPFFRLVQRARRLFRLPVEAVKKAPAVASPLLRCREQLAALVLHFHQRGIDQRFQGATDGFGAASGARDQLAVGEPVARFAFVAIAASFRPTERGAGNDAEQAPLGVVENGHRVVDEDVGEGSK